MEIQIYDFSFFSTFRDDDPYLNSAVADSILPLLPDRGPAIGGKVWKLELLYFFNIIKKQVLSQNTWQADVGVPDTTNLSLLGYQIGTYFLRANGASVGGNSRIGGVQGTQVLF